MDAPPDTLQLASVRVLPHIQKLDDCFGQFLMRVVCGCGACREIGWLWRGRGRAECRRIRTSNSADPTRSNRKFRVSVESTAHEAAGSRQHWLCRAESSKRPCPQSAA